MNRKYKSLKLIFLLFIFIIPLLIFIKIVGLHNENLVSDTLINAIDISIYSICAILGIIIIILEVKKIKIMSFKTSLAMILFFLSLSFNLSAIVNFVYYNNDFKSWLVRTSIGSINYKNVATSVYNEKTIDKIMDAENKRIDFSKDIINYSVKYEEKKFYANKIEEELFNHEEGEIYKIIPISGTTIGANYHYEGFMAIVYDPANVKLAKSTGAGTFPGAYGETLSDISRKNNALVAINAGGFYDPNWNSNGGIPHGDVIIDGKLDSSYTRGLDSGGIVGFDYDGKMILKRMTTEEAVNSNFKYAMDWGPYLIVDGVNKYANVNYYTWACARTAIGQREDGIVLMLVIDGLQEHSKGASYADMAKIMQDYGAINAINMDGGTSTAMTENNKYINKPWNGYVPTFRWLPNAWIVTE